MRRRTPPRRRSQGALARWQQAPAWTGALALLLGVVAGLLAVAAGPGTRWDWWPFTTGFVLLRWSVYVGIATGVLAAGTALVGLWWRPRALIPALPALALALAVVLPPLLMVQAASRVPPIHDITTDTADPPAFRALRDARQRAPNGAAYGGERIARQQRAAYPQVRPLVVEAPPPRVFAAVRAAAEVMGWDVAAADPAAGRLEATATTFWFGFRDDVVVRLTPVAGGTRVDVRSASRVGVSDLGTNARRILAFQQTVRARLAL